MARNVDRKRFNWVEWEINLLNTQIKIAELSGRRFSDVFEEVAEKTNRTYKAVESHYYQVIVPAEKKDEMMNMKPGDTFIKIKRNLKTKTTTKEIYHYLEFVTKNNNYFEEEQYMRKTIKFSDGSSKEMTFEEVLKQFEGLVNKFVLITMHKIVYNKPEKEELLQELKLQVWEAYRRYNGENAFSTYLYYRLQHGIGRGTTKLYAKKRTNTAGTISLNQVLGGEGDAELEFEGLIGEEDADITSYEFRDFIKNVEKKLEPCEKKILRVLLDKSGFSVQDLADELGMSRQGANKKVNKFREKMKTIMRETNFVTC